MTLLRLGRRGRPLPSIYIQAGLHGDERLPPLLVLNLARRLLETERASPGLLSRIAVWILPVANPDGYKRSGVGARRNRRGVNLNVMLNRNFDIDWATLRAGERGRKPESEKETAAIASVLSRQHFVAALDVHAGSPPEVHKPSGTGATDDRVAELVKALAHGLVAKVGVYEASPGGQAVNYFYHVEDIPAVTLELSRNKRLGSYQARAAVARLWLPALESMVAHYAATARAPGPRPYPRWVWRAGLALVVVALGFLARRLRNRKLRVGRS